MNLLNHHQVAAALGLSPRTVERYRREGKGPPHVCLGNAGQKPIRYVDADVYRWALSRGLGVRP